jgi:hypothetical protein
MQHLEGSGTPVLYIGRTVLKGYRSNNIIYIILFYYNYSIIIFYYNTNNNYYNTL